MIFLKKLLNLENHKNSGQSYFYLGTFFLASALPISAIFFFIALIKSILRNRLQVFKDKWNQYLLLIASLFLLTNLRFYFFDNSIELLSFDKAQSLYSLFNWYPLFLIFIYFQTYLKGIKEREIFSKYLISGTIPVIVSCILQLWFKVYGPFITFGGLITWFNKPPGLTEGVTGLFSNSNYTGFWFSTIFPLTIYLITKIKRLNAKSAFLSLVSLLTFYFIISTNSRNAILSFFVSSVFVYGIKGIFAILIILLLTFLISNLLTLTFSSSNLSITNTLFLNNLLEKIYFKNILYLNEFIRVKIWSNSIKLILQKPFFGYGAITFPIFYHLYNNSDFQHSHNMILQIAYENGIPLSIALTSFISLLFYRTYKTINKSRNKNNQERLLNKTWLACLLVAIMHHLSDITYFDGKISILIWILIAGSKCIINEQNESLNYSI